MQKEKLIIHFLFSQIYLKMKHQFMIVGGQMLYTDSFSVLLEVVFPIPCESSSFLQTAHWFTMKALVLDI